MARTPGDKQIYKKGTTDLSSEGSKMKRKFPGANADLGHDDKSTPTRKKKKTESSEEKRLRRFRSKPPSSYLERLSRVRSQRMFLIDRNKTLSIDGEPQEEVFDIAGTTGNVYQVKICRVPTCSCPDSLKGNQCKHIIYVGFMITQ